MYSDLDNFQVISTIRTGCYGPSKKVRSKRDGKIMVLREVDYTTMTESEKRVLLSEVNMLRDLCCDNYILRHYDRIIDQSRPLIHIITEYCEGGDLDKIIVKNRKEGTHIPQQFIWKILIQMTLAVEGCHKGAMPVLHGDLKPANVFLDAEYNIKLGDFGLARVKTPYYMSPAQTWTHIPQQFIWKILIQMTLAVEGCHKGAMPVLHGDLKPANVFLDAEYNIKLGDFGLARVKTPYYMSPACKRSSMIANIRCSVMKSIQYRTLDCPECEHADIDKKILCVINYQFMNRLGRHGTFKYENTLAKERKMKLREKELKKYLKRVTSKEDMSKLVKRPRRCI